MQKDKSDYFLTGLIVGLLIAMILGIIFADRDKRELRQEAIEAGVAEWVLISEPGPGAKYEFRWLKNK